MAKLETIGLVGMSSRPWTLCMADFFPVIIITIKSWMLRMATPTPRHHKEAKRSWKEKAMFPSMRRTSFDYKLEIVVYSKSVCQAQEIEV